ncbi:hypothetical protein L1049_025462 [Liquidambar formosana]|uniref:Uncharacterized protein n=1 Tax=Liquidambar formosana TaxID=63359 RepID=A0AAP0NEN4_LIQFO
MASSKVMSSSTSRNSDRSRRSSSSTKPSSVSDHNKNGNNHHLAAMTVDGLLRNVYAGAPSGQTTLLNAEITLLDSSTTAAAAAAADGQTDNSLSIPRQESFSNVHKTVDDVWKEIVAGERKECKEEEPDEMMTLEDFLARAEAVEEDEVKMPRPLTEADTERLSGGVFAFEPIPSSPFQATQVEGSAIGFGNGVDVIGGGRGKRRAAVLEPLDKAAQQRQPHGESGPGCGAAKTGTCSSQSSLLAVVDYSLYA